MATPCRFLISIVRRKLVSASGSGICSVSMLVTPKTQPSGSHSVSSGLPAVSIGTPGAGVAAAPTRKFIKRLHFLQHLRIFRVALRSILQAFQGFGSIAVLSQDIGFFEESIRCRK